MTVWTPIRVAVLKNYLDMGLTSSQIGEKLGITKNAVIGASHRHGFRGNKDARLETVRKTNARVGQERKKPQPEMKKPLPKVHADPLPPIPKKELISFAKALAGCLFCEGDPKSGGVWCGELRARNGVYCADHQARISEKKAVRKAYCTGAF